MQTMNGNPKRMVPRPPRRPHAHAPLTPPQVGSEGIFHVAGLTVAREIQATPDQNCSYQPRLDVQGRPPSSQESNEQLQQTNRQDRNPFTSQLPAIDGTGQNGHLSTPPSHPTSNGTMPVRRSMASHPLGFIQVANEGSLPVHEARTHNPNYDPDWTSQMLARTDSLNVSFSSLEAVHETLEWKEFSETSKRTEEKVSFFFKNINPVEMEYYRVKHLEEEENERLKMEKVETKFHLGPATRWQPEMEGKERRRRARFAVADKNLAHESSAGNVKPGRGPPANMLQLEQGTALYPRNPYDQLHLWTEDGHVAQCPDALTEDWRNLDPKTHWSACKVFNLPPGPIIPSVISKFAPHERKRMKKKGEEKNNY
ncbi:MAG: hypothetical protein M1834_006058 [Cirrosporium novae-zelandiae]|nr:MAG: hypothetical protein M1834_006058 [Cirrosporium novae-zelandiae]